MLKTIGLLGLLGLLAIVAAGMMAMPFGGIGTLLITGDDHEHIVLGGILGWMITGFVMLIVGAVLTVVFTGVSVVLVGVGCVVAVVVLLALTPIWLPLLLILGLPILLIYLFVKAMA